MVLALPLYSWPLLQGAGCNRTKQTISGLQEEDPIYAARSYPNFSVLFFYLLTVSLGIFSVAQTWALICSPRLQNRKCLEHQAGDNPVSFPNPNPHIWFHFNTVKEDLRTEVQGSGWGRAVLWTDKRFRQPKANRKGTLADSAILREVFFSFSRYKENTIEQLILRDARGCFPF